MARSRTGRWSGPPAVLVAAGAMVLAAGGLRADAADRGREIRACAQLAEPRTVRLALAGESCRVSEKLLAWNTAGAPGDSGPAGPIGARGPQGPPGPRGEVGLGAAFPGIDVVRGTRRKVDTNYHRTSARCPKYTLPITIGWQFIPRQRLPEDRTALVEVAEARPYLTESERSLDAQTVVRLEFNRRRSHSAKAVPPAPFDVEFAIDCLRAPQGLYRAGFAAREQKPFSGFTHHLRPATP